jgi:hypothetical protein
MRRVPQAIRERAKRRAFITRVVQELWIHDTGWILRCAGDKTPMPEGACFVERFRWEASWCLTGQGVEHV